MMKTTSTSSGATIKQFSSFLSELNRAKQSGKSIIRNDSNVNGMISQLEKRLAA